MIFILLFFKVMGNHHRLRDEIHILQLCFVVLLAKICWTSILIAICTEIGADFAENSTLVSTLPTRCTIWSILKKMVVEISMGGQNVLHFTVRKKLELSD